MGMMRKESEGNAMQITKEELRERLQNLADKAQEYKDNPSLREYFCDFILGYVNGWGKLEGFEVKIKESEVDNHV